MYINEGDIENLILEDIDPSFSTWIDSVISMVGNYVDNYCGTDYSVVSAGAPKFYDTFGGNEIVIDPVEDITEILILDIYGNTEVTLNSSDYLLYPLTEESKTIVRLKDGAQISRFPDRLSALKVTGTFGSGSSVPGAVKLAAIKLASRIINEGLRGGQVGSESLGEYSVTYKDVDDEAEALGVKEILNQFRRIEMV